MNYLKTYLLLAQIIVMSYWLSTNKTEVVTKAFKNKSLITIFLYNAWGILFALQIFLGPIWSFAVPSALKILGIAIYSFGAVLAVWAKRSLGRSWGLPEQHYKSSQKMLVLQGAYKFSRNPIYLSELVMLFGFELALGSMLVALVVPFYIFNKRKIVIEERILEKTFGDKYLKYKRSVRRFI